MNCDNCNIEAELLESCNVSLKYRYRVSIKCDHMFCESCMENMVEFNSYHCAKCNNDDPKWIIYRDRAKRDLISERVLIGILEQLSHPNTKLKESFHNSIHCAKCRYRHQDIREG